MYLRMPVDSKQHLHVLVRQNKRLLGDCCDLNPNDEANALPFLHGLMRSCAILPICTIGEL